MRKILPLFSYLFHPLFIPLYTTVSFLFLDDTYLSGSEKFLLVIQLIIITILIPGAFFLFLRSLGRVNSVMASEANERKLPLLAQAILLSFLVWQGPIFERVPELRFFFLGAIASTLIALAFILANKKISLHVMGIGGLLFFVIGLSFYNRENSVSYLAFLTAVTGLVASSRMHMKAHSSEEIAIGFLAGIFPQLALWQFWL